MTMDKRRKALEDEYFARQDKGKVEVKDTPKVSLSERIEAANKAAYEPKAAALNHGTDTLNHILKASLGMVVVATLLIGGLFWLVM